MVEKKKVVVLVIGSDIVIGVMVAVIGKTVVGAVGEGFEVLVDGNIVNDNDEIMIDCVVDDIVVVYDDNMDINIIVIMNEIFVFIACGKRDEVVVVYI